MNWIVGIAIVLAAAVGGYLFRGERNQAEIVAAQSRATLCESTAATTADTVADVRARLADLQRRHERAIADATAALDSRDAEIAALNQSAAARAARIRSVANEDPDVAALARLPVPAAIARELWPVRPPAGTSAAGAH